MKPRTTVCCVLGALVVASCTSFSPGALPEADAGTADGAAPAADGGPDASADAPDGGRARRTGKITCFNIATCNADEDQRCCVVYQAGAPDYCFEASGKCESDAGAPVAPVECIDDSNCPAKTSCCGIPGANNQFLAIQCRATCPAGATQMCDLTVNPSRCATGLTCSPGRHPQYFECR
jgi:hypothetical protein